MALFSFFSAPKPQKFKYVPRYYDPRKEKLNEILGKAADGKDLSDADKAKLRIARSFHGRNTDGEFARRGRRRSNLILLAVIAILLVFSYLILSVYLPQFVQMIEG